MDKELERRLSQAIRQQQLERLERMVDPRIEKLKQDPDLQESLQRWRAEISAAQARWAQEHPDILDGDETIYDGPDSPRDLDHPFDGIPEEFLPSGPRGEAILKERERRLQEWDRDHPS